MTKSLSETQDRWQPFDDPLDSGLLITNHLASSGTLSEPLLPFSYFQELCSLPTLNKSSSRSSPLFQTCLFFSACTLLNEFPDPRLLFVYPPVHTYGWAVNQLLFSISLSISTSGFYCVTSWHGNGQSAYSLQNPQHHHAWHSGRSCPAHWPLVHSPAMEETTTMLPLVCFSMGKAAVLRTT